MISLFFILGFTQLLWLSVMLAKRGIEPDTLWQSSMPLLLIWVLSWPIYTQKIWLWLPIAVLLVSAALSHFYKRPFWQYLHTIWGGYTQQQQQLPWRLLSFIASIAIAIAFFQNIPEFGFGLALTACVSFPLASLCDRIQHLQLGFTLHPEQTLFGHIGIISSAAFLCAWSVHLYHGIDWQPLFIATLIAAMAASLCRAILPAQWNMPAAILTMGWILWLL